MLKNYILVAVRNILRNKTISFINIFGLAVSMTVCLLLIIIVADQYSYDDFHSDSDKIYRVITDREKQNDGIWSTATAPFPLAANLRVQQGVEELALVKTILKVLPNGNKLKFHFKDCLVVMKSLAFLISR